MLPSSNVTDSKDSISPDRFEGFHPPVNRSAIPDYGGGFILGIATAVGSIVKRNAEYNEQRCKETEPPSL